MNIELNAERKLYVIADSSGGYTCFGFDNAQRDTAHIAGVLKREDLIPGAEDYGTHAGYEKYLAASDAWAASIHSRKTWFTPGTDRKVQAILETYRQSGRLLRVFLGDVRTGRDWMCEHDVVGIVGRSTGSKKIPLLVVPGENGGGGLLTDCIVRLMDADGTEVYRHPLYKAPTLRMDVETDADMRARGYRWAVSHKGEVLARFADAFDASEFVEFITGRIATRRDQMLYALNAA
jgi:hypothetical protein